MLILKITSAPPSPGRAISGAWSAAGAWSASCLLLLLMAGCGSAYRYSTTEHRDLGLGNAGFEKLGLAVITPSTVTGQEEEKQAVAFVFAEVIRRERPGIRLVPLAETLSAINAQGLADRYRRAYQEYRESGVLGRDALSSIGEATNARYVVALKLSGFDQSTENRFGAFGVRIIDTKRARVRLFLQIWDTKTGAIVWEGLQETSTAEEAVTESLVTFRQALEEACKALIEQLPVPSGNPPASS